MKPQCTTAAGCLRELARVMEQFGIDNTLNAINSKYVLLEGTRAGLVYVTEFQHPEYWQFAITEVEGKPVFIGDELYDTREAGNYKLVAGEYSNGFICEEGYSEKGYGRSTSIDCLSWNPPRPKTVMVEMTVEDAEFEAGKLQYSFDECKAYAGRKEAACKKALEELK